MASASLERARVPPSSREGGRPRRSARVVRTKAYGPFDPASLLDPGFDVELAREVAAQVCCG